MIKVIQFQPQYKERVKTLIYLALKELGMTLEDVVPGDLEKISEVYKDRSRFFVAILASKVIGTVAIQRVGKKVCKLRRLFISPEHQGSGIGEELLEIALDFAKECEFGKVVLASNRKMVRAHGFYEHHGFAKTSEDEKRFYYEKILIEEGITAKNLFLSNKR